MIKITLPAGFYVLNTDVANPKPDRRYKTNPAYYTTWKKGSRWQISHFDHIPSVIKTGTGQTIEFDEQAEVILKHLEPVGDAIGHFIDSYSARLGSAILALAVEQGIMTVEQVKTLAQKTDDLDETQFDELMRKHWIWND